MNIHRHLFAWRYRILSVVSPLLVLGVWHWVAIKGVFPPQILIAPAEVVRAGIQLYEDGELWYSLSYSLKTLFGGYLLGALLGIVFGILMARVRTVNDYLGPVFHAVRQMPTVAMIPVFVLLFGVEELFKIAIVLKATFFIVALAAYGGTRNISRNYFEIAKLYSLPPLTQFFRLVIPAMLPSVLTGLRIGLARSWTVLVAAEIIVSNAGLGYMVEISRQLFRLDIVMFGVALMGIIGFTLDRLLKLGERFVVRWQPLAR